MTAVSVKKEENVLVYFLPIEMAAFLKWAGIRRRVSVSDTSNEPLNQTTNKPNN